MFLEVNQVSFLLGLMGISQRETIIALENLLSYIVWFTGISGVQGFFLKMEDQFRGIQNEKMVVNTLLYTFQGLLLLLLE